MTMITTIRPGLPGELVEIGAVLADAFQEPVTRWLVPC